MILVTGATGNVGRETVHALVRRDEHVRALVRDRTQVLLPDGVELAEGDLNAPDSLTDAFDDVSAIFLLPGYEHAEDTLAKAKEVGVERVTLLSGTSAASDDRTNAVTAYMLESEDAVRESGLAWTILRSYAMFSNTLRWLGQLEQGDTVRDTFGAVPSAMVDPYDIGEVAAEMLTSDSYDGRILTLSGAEPLRPEDRVKILGSAIERDLRFDAIPDDEARAELEPTMPKAYVDAFLDFYVDGSLDESEPTDDVREVLGRAPRTFEEWADAHRDRFRHTGR
jgi:uncharacterized protein YbjT (DUF2867 family)